MVNWPRWGPLTKMRLRACSGETSARKRRWRSRPLWPQVGASDGRRRLSICLRGPDALDHVGRVRGMWWALCYQRLRLPGLPPAWARSRQCTPMWCRCPSPRRRTQRKALRSEPQKLVMTCRTLPSERPCSSGYVQRLPGENAARRVQRSAAEGRGASTIGTTPSRRGRPKGRAGALRARIEAQGRTPATHAAR